MIKSIKNDVKQSIRTRYGRIARTTDPTTNSCGCGCSNQLPIQHATSIGYSQIDVQTAPAGSNLGLGCGNPKALADIKPGETVLDLGSGAGFDCFLAAREVGPGGRVIGVDMTEDMVAKARGNAESAGFRNVEFRLGEIESLPVDDESVDVVISNCVINLAPDKESVFKEVYRVLKPGGRVAVSDIVARSDLPETVKSDPNLVCACIGGAETVENLAQYMSAAGLENINIGINGAVDESYTQRPEKAETADLVFSAWIEATKP